MARSRLQQTKNDLIYALLRTFSAAGGALPLGVSRSIGRGLGGLSHAILGRERRKAETSIRIAFPEMNDAGRRDLVRRMFTHLGESLLEIAWMPNLDAKRLAETTEFSGLEHLRAAVDEGKGVVLFTGHCGNWEWLAAAIGLSGFKMNVVAREIYDPRINAYVTASRARHGVQSIGRGTSGAARELLSTLRSGAILGVLIDQNIDAESVEVPFFGRPAKTPVGPAKMAIRSGAAAIAAFIERRDGKQYARFEPFLRTSRDDDPAELTRLMTAAIEAQIRLVPDQWVWMHQRWGKGPR